MFWENISYNSYQYDYKDLNSGTIFGISNFLVCLFFYKKYHALTQLLDILVVLQVVAEYGIIFIIQKHFYWAFSRLTS